MEPWALMVYVLTETSWSRIPRVMGGERPKGTGCYGMSWGVSERMRRNFLMSLFVSEVTILLECNDVHSFGQQSVRFVIIGCHSLRGAS